MPKTFSTTTGYSILDADKVVETVEQLADRIQARFPNAGLYRVCLQLKDVATLAKERSRQISRPFWSLRILTAMIVLAVLAILIAVFFSVKISDETLVLRELVQVLEAGMSAVVIIGAAVLFLATLGIRLKRRRALAAIHEIRSIAHVIDMHQLRKTPERLKPVYVATDASPTNALKPFELGRYLDYCSEMLALTSKVAALYVQEFDDPVAIATANEVEELCTGLSRKIWQKIVTLDKVRETSEGQGN